MEIEKLQNEIKKKNRQIDQLKWEIASLQVAFLISTVR